MASDPLHRDVGPEAIRQIESWLPRDNESTARKKLHSLAEDRDTAWRRVTDLESRLERADKLVSKAHDALWHYDGQPTSRGNGEAVVWNLARDEMNGLIWKLHDLLRDT